MENEEKGIPKGVLQIDEVTMDDRNTYTCVASNIASKFSNATESSSFVRIIDKLAALWPFLGICAEVVVLCTIILIYEKKRNKSELDESDTDGSPEQLSKIFSAKIVLKRFKISTELICSCQDVMNSFVQDLVVKY